jgi:DNA-binding MarR family transcriptional regulator
MDRDLRELMGCTCLGLRKLTRRVTQLYDHALEPAGLTSSQFGLLSYLEAALQKGAKGLSIGDLAERQAMDPTTLNRNLKPLEQRDLVGSALDPTDRRVRIVSITGKGREALRQAIPLWRGAHVQLRRTLGQRATASLNKLIAESTAKLADSK